MGKLLAVNEVARRFNVTSQTIKNYISRGCLKAHLMNGRYYIDSDTVEKLQDSLREVSEMENRLSRLKQELKAERGNVKNTIANFKGTNTLLGLLANNEVVRELIYRMAVSWFDESLTNRERHIMCSFLQSLNGMEYSSREFGISRTRVTQIAYAALRKLGKAPTYGSLVRENEKLKDFLHSLKQRYDEVNKENEKLKQDNARGKVNNQGLSQQELELCKVLQTKVNDVGLSVRSLNVLHAADCSTLGDVVNYNKSDILKFRNMGKKSLKEITDMLASFGLSWGMDNEALMKKYIDYTTNKL